MIHLDANYLIDSLKLGSQAASSLKKWIRQGETFAASAVAWSEFLNGPLRLDQIQQVEFLVQYNIVPFGHYEAKLSAELFNKTGRRRGSQPDCFIAATAITAGGILATQNQKHFLRFVPMGLILA
jgi:predicted nucleic acid-binding protein